MTAGDRIEARMIELGHMPIDDAIRYVRRTCTTCGKAGLNAGGPDYGSALASPCPGDWRK